MYGKDWTVESVKAADEVHAVVGLGPPSGWRGGPGCPPGRITSYSADSLCGGEADKARGEPATAPGERQSGAIPLARGVPEGRRDDRRSGGRRDGLADNPSRAARRSRDLRTAHSASSRTRCERSMASATRSDMFSRRNSNRRSLTVNRSHEFQVAKRVPHQATVPEFCGSRPPGEDEPYSAPSRTTSRTTAVTRLVVRSFALPAVGSADYGRPRPAPCRLPDVASPSGPLIGCRAFPPRTTRHQAPGMSAFDVRRLRRRAARSRRPNDEEAAPTGSSVGLERIKGRPLSARIKPPCSDRFAECVRRGLQTITDVG